MKVISIVIATYNAGSTIANCLDSVMPQLSDRIELIIIDGGSSDCTVDIIRQYGGSVSYFVSEPDNGIYDAWNKGIRQSKGDWIMFLGADDVLMPDVIETYVKFINNNDTSDLDYICAQVEYTDESGRLLNVYGKAPSWDCLKYSISAAHVSSLHNRDRLFGQVGLFDTQYNICADYEMLLRKGSDLKYAFLEHKTARMMTGGRSFSTAAVFEAYRIRKIHHTISVPMNWMVTAKDWLVLVTYRLRHRNE